MTVLTYYLGWPHGAIWSNLLASVIWATPALIHLHRKLNRHHREQLAPKDGQQ
jgi:hypothetical protein